MNMQSLFLGITLLLLFSCAHPNQTNQGKGVAVLKKAFEMDSLSYLKMFEKISKLDDSDTTNQQTMSNTQLIDDFYDFLTREVKDYDFYKPFYNEMTSSQDTIFIRKKSQNFYRYLKKDSKTKLIFDANMEDTRTLPKTLKKALLNLTLDKSKDLLISDSTFSQSLLLTFKGHSIHRLMFVYYLD